MAIGRINTGKTVERRPSVYKKFNVAGEPGTGPSWASCSDCRHYEKIPRQRIYGCGLWRDASRPSAPLRPEDNIPWYFPSCWRFEWVRS